MTRAPRGERQSLSQIYGLRQTLHTGKGRAGEEQRGKRRGYRWALPKWRERERAKPVPFLVSKGKRFYRFPFDEHLDFFAARR
ncbi:hypothetical protein [Treponema endosymbiont of Eucomonympha sp.]|uniref:hypothetical protein n=1 Tax=Treponema endosymbiont of Eucomonympha sp. TaxID=1580831 RepID=UPI001E3A94B3|nr:hypothetical protein [Treponema endosymbiont of Eucomonympha sp.]